MSKGPLDPPSSLSGADVPEAAPAIPDTRLMQTLLKPGALVLDGRFRVVRLLGSGGMGEVYAGEQVSLKRQVALKVLRRDLSAQPGMTERFQREALLLSSVDHPSVVRVIDFGEAEGAQILVMELVSGDTLEYALRAGPLPVSRAVPLLCQLAQGLAAIHAHGIVHRDLKPANVILTQGATGERARLLDFGIARFAEPAQGQQVTQVGMVLGTPEFLSPEQAMGLPVDARSDLYSWGVLAFRTLAGSLPFEGPTPSQFLAQHAHQSPRSIIQAQPGLAPPALCELVMRCLEKQPGQRFGTAEELARALAAIALPDPTPSPPPNAAVPGSSRPPPPVSPSRVNSGAHLTTRRPRNLVVMLTDIKGFTARSSGQTHQQNAAMLHEHDRLLLPLARAHGGKLVQKRGDALVLVFESPTGAVLAGMAMQDGLWRRNQAAPVEQQVHVRIGIHAGDVLFGNGLLIGEPVEVVEAVEGQAPEDEVVFTEAVHLAMNRPEVPTEAFGALEMPGRSGESLRLFRVTRCVDGPPYGGRDEAAAALISGWTRTLRATLEGGKRAWGRGLPRAFLAALAGLCLLTVAAVVFALWRQHSATSQAERLLEAGLTEEALATLERGQEHGDSDPRLPGLRAWALHRLSRHNEEWEALATLDAEQVVALRAENFAALAEDYGRRERGAEGSAGLERIPREVVATRFGVLAAGNASDVSWGALRYLDTAHLADDGELLRLYALALRTESCDRRSVAASRLGELKAEAAIPELEQLARLPKKRVLFFDQNCGQDQAARAVRKIRKASPSTEGP